jgi:hypothetical protein
LAHQKIYNNVDTKRAGSAKSEQAKLLVRKKSFVLFSWKEKKGKEAFTSKNSTKFQ